MKKALVFAGAIILFASSSALAIDIEAGPIGNNDVARRICPSVCSSLKWNSQWVTTQPGVMSECGTTAGANVPVGPIWNNDDARNKCPTQLSKVSWSGQWRTTRPGVMSVCGCTPPTDDASEEALATKFAPLLMFDRAAKDYGYPMSAQEYYYAIRHTPREPPPPKIPSSGSPLENTDLSKAQSGAVPTYYMFKEVEDGGHKQVRINYWSFYGYQHACNTTGIGDPGSHNGDWEHIMVILTEDRKDIAAVVFYQHSGQYTRIAGPRDAPCTPSGTGRCTKHGFERHDGTHPVVYVAKFAHGSYHERANGIEGVGSCAYWGDFRNPGSNDSMETWRKLVDLAGDSEPWLAADRHGDFSWGPGGVNTHPTKEIPSASMDSCEGLATYDTLLSIGSGTGIPPVDSAYHAAGLDFISKQKANGCYQSECLAGDDEASEDCLKECEHGYTNTGLTCTKLWEKFLPEDVYGRLNSGKHYGYKYKIPVRDVGLSKRRHDNSDWHLP